MQKKKLTEAEIERIKDEDANSYRNFARRSEESGEIARIVDCITEDSKNPTEFAIQARENMLARWREEEKKGGGPAPILSNGEINPEFIKEDNRLLQETEAELLGINQE